MKIVNKLAILISSSCLLLQACTKSFEEVNTDPNRLEKVSAGTLLNPSIYGLAAFNMERSADFTMHIMQVGLTFPSVSGGIHRYDLTENTGNSTWTTYYKWLKNIAEMKHAADAANDPNYQAIAMTLNAWAYSILSDCFGDVPMTDAGRGDEGVLYPAFNRQEDIYNKMLNDLEVANGLFDSTRGLIYGTDILYGSADAANAVVKWKKFCNSLHMRMLLRLSKRTELNSLNKLAQMIQQPDKYPVFNNNQDAAILSITGAEPNISPWGRALDFRNARAGAEFFINNLVNYKDPRLARFFTQATEKQGSATVQIGYKGIPSAYSGPESQFKFQPSTYNTELVIAPMIAPMLPYAEVEFIKAEMAQRGLVQLNAKDCYEKGVKAAIEMWGLVMPGDYFTNTVTAPYTAYDGTLERIMLQKYYSLFFVDYQQWFEYRRTGLPLLPKGSGLMNNGVMPVRFRYPVSIATSNAANYEKAVQAMGGDDINTKVWWEK